MPTEPTHTHIRAYQIVHEKCTEKARYKILCVLCVPFLCDFYAFFVRLLCNFCAQIMHKNGSHRIVERVFFVQYSCDFRVVKNADLFFYSYRQFEAKKNEYSTLH